MCICLHYTVTTVVQCYCVVVVQFTCLRDIACKQKLKNVSESLCCFLDVNNLTRCDVTAKNRVA